MISVVGFIRFVGWKLNKISSRSLFSYKIQSQGQAEGQTSKVNLPNERAESPDSKEHLMISVIGFVRFLDWKVRKIAQGQFFVIKVEFKVNLKFNH